jgi:hypothetical protein
MTTTFTPFTAEEKAQLLQEMREHDAYLASIKPTPPACPAWCTQPAGHDYDCTDGDEGFIRSHSTERNDRRAWVWQRETNTAGVLTFEEVSIGVDEGDLGADQARKLAADLLAAADVLDAQAITA